MDRASVCNSRHRLPNTAISGWAGSTAGRCDYCDVNYACGATDWTRARKREHELLEDLVSLQRHGPGEVSDDAGA